MFFDRITEFDFSLVTAEEVWIMVLGYLIVFLVLSMLFVIFKNLPTILKLGSKLKSTLQKQKEQLAEATENLKLNGNAKSKESKQKPEISGEVNAAIGAAIHLYANEHHDEESTVLTIEKVSRRYSPWSSKIYSVTNLR